MTKQLLEMNVVILVVLQWGCQMCGDQMPPTGLGQHCGHHSEIPAVEFHFPWSKDNKECLFCSFERMSWVVKELCFVSSLKQDYVSYNYLDIIVKASISLDVSAKNIVLRNPETQVTVSYSSVNAVKSVTFKTLIDVDEILCESTKQLDLL